MGKEKNNVSDWMGKKMETLSFLEELSSRHPLEVDLNVF